MQKKHILRSLAAVPVAAALAFTLGANLSSAGTTAQGGTTAKDGTGADSVYRKWSQGSFSYNSATDTIKVKDRKKDGKTFAVSLFGPAADRVYRCDVSGKGKTDTCDYNFNNGHRRLNVLVFTERGTKRWDVFKGHMAA